MARSNAKDPAPQGEGEQRGGPVMGTAVIRGNTFGARSVTYYDVDGMALFEGDIAIGRTEDVKAATDGARDAVASGDPAVAFGVGITGSQFRWPNCQIPYEIDPALPNQARVTDAIAHWEQKTPFRFPLRTAANAGSYPNYVRFGDQGGCWSYLGMQGGQQPISLGSGCSTGNAIHEIGHTVGLWHEQSREDRDLFVTINWANIQAGMAAQFNQHITDGDDLGAYDYGSIMHYPRTAFSANGQETITPTDANAQIGQRTGLSAGDIAAVAQMYPGCQIVVKPAWRDGAGIKKLIDEPPPFKKFRDDQRFKKVRDDELVLKPIRDPIKIAGDPGPIKRDIFPNPGGRDPARGAAAVRRRDRSPRCARRRPGRDAGGRRLERRLRRRTAAPAAGGRGCHRPGEGDRSPGERGRRPSQRGERQPGAGIRTGDGGARRHVAGDDHRRLASR